MHIMHIYNLPFFTSIGFVVPLYYYPQYNYLGFIVFFTYLNSVTFWSNPVLYRNTLVHKLDSFTARLCILSFVFYKFVINKKNVVLFSANTLYMLYFFYLSNRVSSRYWCCDLHICLHLFAHILGINSIYIALMN